MFTTLALLRDLAEFREFYSSQISSSILGKQASIVNPTIWEKNVCWLGTPYKALNIKKIWFLEYYAQKQLLCWISDKAMK